MIRLRLRKIKYFLLVTGVSALVLVTYGQWSSPQSHSVKTVLMSHPWQLIEEEGLNLAKETLADNIIEFDEENSLVYYLGRDDMKVFTENKWKLSSNQKNIIETLPDDTEIRCSIVQLNPEKLVLQYRERDGHGGWMSVKETYQRYTKK